MREWKGKNHVQINERRRELYEQYNAQRRKEKTERLRLERPMRERAQLIRVGMRERSRERGLEFDADILTVDYIIEWLKNTPLCPCCGTEIDYGFKAGNRKNNSPSIDRFDPSRGYTVDNISILCWRCNNLKRDATADELEVIIRWMRSNET
jgi:hypothetical protein